MPTKARKREAYNGEQNAEPPQRSRVRIFNLNKPGGVEALAIATGKRRELVAGEEWMITAGAPPGTIRQKCGALAQIEHSPEQIAAHAEGAALAHEIRQGRERRRLSKIARVSKLRAGIYAATVEVLQRTPALTARAVWERIPTLDGPERAGPILAAGFEVYRTETTETSRHGKRKSEVVCQANGPEPDDEVVFPTFRRYVTLGKKELRLRSN